MVQKLSVEKLSAKLKTFGLFSISTFLMVLKNFRYFFRSTPQVENFRPFLVQVRTLDGNFNPCAVRPKNPVRGKRRWIHRLRDYESSVRGKSEWIHRLYDSLVRGKWVSNLLFNFEATKFLRLFSNLNRLRTISWIYGCQKIITIYSRIKKL